MGYLRFTTICAAILASPSGAALASNDERANPGLLLSGLRTYVGRDAAERQCRDSLVVWADRFTSFYYERSEPKYRATYDGSYTCQSDARKSGYWSAGPRGGMEVHPGRTFPFDRLFFGS